MSGKARQRSRAGTSRTAAAAELRRGREVRLLLRPEGPDAVLLRPVQGADVRGGDVVLARTGMTGTGRLELRQVLALRADMARLGGGVGWVLLENIFGRVARD